MALSAGMTRLYSDPLSRFEALHSRAHLKHDACALVAEDQGASDNEVPDPAIGEIVNVTGADTHSPNLNHNLVRFRFGLGTGFQPYITNSIHYSSFHGSSFNILGLIMKASIGYTRLPVKIKGNKERSLREYDEEGP
jgi:hypothetical protein